VRDAIHGGNFMIVRHVGDPNGEPCMRIVIKQAENLKLMAEDAAGVTA
jgi:hypothetical protein